MRAQAEHESKLAEASWGQVVPTMPSADHTFMNTFEINQVQSEHQTWPTDPQIHEQ